MNTKWILFAIISNKSHRYFPENFIATNVDRLGTTVGGCYPKLVMDIHSTHGLTVFKTQKGYFSGKYH